MIHIIQCLCPKRHAIFGVAYHPEVSNGEEVMADFKKVVVRAITEKQINPWCGICRAVATDWTYEDAPTKFATLQEAMPQLMRLEAEQLRAARYFEEQKKKAGRN